MYAQVRFHVEQAKPVLRIPGTAHGARAEVHQVPVVGETIRARILAHGGDADAVAELDGADLERLKQAGGWAHVSSIEQQSRDRKGAVRIVSTGQIWYDAAAKSEVMATASPRRGAGHVRPLRVAVRPPGAWGHASCRPESKAAASEHFRPVA
jgi:hypothetical protein